MSQGRLTSSIGVRRMKAGLGNSRETKLKVILHELSSLSLHDSSTHVIVTLVTGGPTYCALASLALTPPEYAPLSKLSKAQRRRAIRWLILQPDYGTEYEDENGDWIVCEGMGGFGGRTDKPADVCYSFWCGSCIGLERRGCALAARKGGEKSESVEMHVQGCQRRYCRDS